MNTFLNGYSGFGFELNIELNHRWPDSMKKYIFKTDWPGLDEPQCNPPPIPDICYFGTPPYHFAL